MIDLTVLFFMLMRQFMMPIIVTASSLWSWAYFGDTALVPQTKIGRDAQELIYNVKFHPITKGIIQFLSTQDYTAEINDITNTIKTHTGLERLNAIKALGMLKEDSGEAAVPMLVWSLYDENEEVRKTSIESISKIMQHVEIKDTESLKPMLEQLQNHPDGSVRQIIYALLKATGYVTVPGAVNFQGDMK